MKIHFTPYIALFVVLSNLFVSCSKKIDVDLARLNEQNLCRAFVLAATANNSAVLEQLYWPGSNKELLDIEISDMMRGFNGGSDFGGKSTFVDFEFVSLDLYHQSFDETIWHDRNGRRISNGEIPAKVVRFNFILSASGLSTTGHMTLFQTIVMHDGKYYFNSIKYAK